MPLPLPIRSSRPASGKLSKDKGKGSRRSNATSDSDSDSDDEDANDSDYEGGAGAPAAGAAAGVGGVSLRLSSKGGTTATTAGASLPYRSASHSDHPLSSSLLDGSGSRPLGGSHRSGGGGGRPLPSSAFALELARLSDGSGGSRRGGAGASGPPLDEDADMFFPVDDAELLEELMMGGDGDHGAAPFDAAMPGGDGYETLEQEVGGVEAVHFCLFAAPRHA